MHCCSVHWWKLLLVFQIVHWLDTKVDNWNLYKSELCDMNHCFIVLFVKVVGGECCSLLRCQSCPLVSEYSIFALQCKLHNSMVFSVAWKTLVTSIYRLVYFYSIMYSLPMVNFLSSLLQTCIYRSSWKGIECHTLLYISRISYTGKLQSPAVCWMDKISTSEWLHKFQEISQITKENPNIYNIIIH